MYQWLPYNIQLLLRMTVLVLCVLVLYSLQLHSLAGGSDANTSIVENRILNLFDQLYQSYVLKVRV